MPECKVRTLFPPERSKRLLLLLDEADKFLEQDGSDAFHQTQRLKNLMEATDRRVKVVFAGLHNVLRMTEQANHPLAHLGDPIEVGPLAKPGESAEARNMIVGPLRASGYELASEQLVMRILAQTNYYPVLIQLYGEELLRLLNDPNRRRFDFDSGPRYLVAETVVDEAYMSKSLREAIRSRFQYTLQLDPRYPQGGAPLFDQRAGSSACEANAWRPVSVAHEAGSHFGFAAVRSSARQRRDDGFVLATLDCA